MPEKRRAVSSSVIEGKYNAFRKLYPGDPVREASEAAKYLRYIGRVKTVNVDTVAVEYEGETRNYDSDHVVLANPSAIRKTTSKHRAATSGATRPFRVHF